MWISIPEDILYEVIDDESFEKYVTKEGYIFEDIIDNPAKEDLLTHLALEYYLKDNILEYHHDKVNHTYDVCIEFGEE